MTRDEFVRSLRAVLEGHSRVAAERILQTLGSIPAAARGLDFQIMPSQEGDGPFSVSASLEGPDLYVLNKAIGGCASIFAVVHTGTGLDPPVPMVDPDDVEFEVNDTIVDVAAEWLQQVWRGLEIPAEGIPVRIVGEEGWGTKTPVALRR